MAAIRLPLISLLKSRDRFAKIGAPGVCAVGVSGFARDCRGAIAIEFLIILGPALLLLLGIIDIGLVMLTETRINFAVEAAAKCGAISAALCSSPSQTAAYGASIAGLPGLAASSFLVTTAACGISVTATYAYSGVVLPAVTLSAGACYPTG